MFSFNSTTRDQSVIRRAVVSNLLCIGMFAGALTALYAGLQSMALNQQLLLRAETVTEFLAVQSQFGILVNDRDGLQRIATNALAVDDVVSVDLADPSGQPLVHVAKKNAAASPVLISSREVARPGNGGLLEWETGRPGEKLGTVQLAFSTERQSRLLRRTILFGIAAILACLIVILAIQYRQLRGLLWPLRGLTEFAARLAKGDPQRRAEVVRNDEIGRLAVAFNQMLDELGATTVSKNYVNNILHSMAESMIVVDPSERIQTVNQAALSLLGYSEAELIGQPAAMIIQSGPAPAPGTGACERTYRLKSGVEIPVLFSAASLPGEQGPGEQGPGEQERSGEVWLAQDISERKRAEEELRRAKQEAETASRAKTDLLSRTSHELRTPLNAILGFAQLLEMSELSNNDRSNVGQILIAGRHLLRLINEVLDIAGLESGRRGLSLEAVFLRDAIAESVDLVRPLAAQRRIAIHDSVNSVHWAMADRQRLQQVFINLLSNAIKYNRTGGDVLIDCETRPNRFLRIAVRDTGIGISEENLGKVFTPFERLGADLAGIEGTGLGLSFAHSFMTAMGGDIGVSSAEGKGTTFWIDIPTADAPVMPQVHSGPAFDHHGCASDTPFRLLYIEDNGSNRELVQRILTYRPSIKLTAVNNGAAGVAHAREFVPDLILLDLHLPDIWGDEVLRRLRRDPSTAEIPVIILSADATPAQIQRLLAMGADSYLTKPLDIRELLAVLDEKCEARKVPC